MTEIKIVLVGVGGVGKSAATITFVCKRWVSDYDPTIEDSHRKQVCVDGATHMLEILDTAGQEEFSCMQDEWFRSGEGFLLMYSITSERTLQEATRLYHKVLKIKNKDKVAMVLCGNKADLTDEREVSPEEGRALATQIGCPFFETSAKNHTNIDEAFEGLVKEVRNFRRMEGRNVGGGTPSSGLAGSTLKRRDTTTISKKKCSLF